MPFIIYADVESLIQKIDGYANYLVSSSATKVREHIPCVYLMTNIWAFDHIENKHTLYHAKELILKRKKCYC